MLVSMVKHAGFLSLITSPVCNLEQHDAAKLLILNNYVNSYSNIFPRVVINIFTLIKVVSSMVIQKSGIFLQHGDTKYVLLVLTVLIKMVLLNAPIDLLVIMFVLCLKEVGGLN